MRIYKFDVYEYMHTYLHIQECNAYIFAYLFFVVYVHEIHVKIYVTLKCECMSKCESKYTRRFSAIYTYEAPTISRLLKMIRLFCKRALQKRPTIWWSLLSVATPYKNVHACVHICTCTHKNMYIDMNLRYISMHTLRYDAYTQRELCWGLRLWGGYQESWLWGGYQESDRQVSTSLSKK